MAVKDSTGVKQKIGISFIYLVGLLNLVPHLFEEPWDVNVYYTILFILKFYLSSTIPYIFCQIPFIYKILSAFFAGWMLSGVVTHILNFEFPYENFNNMENSVIYTRIILAMITTIILTMFYETMRRKDERFI